MESPAIGGPSFDTREPSDHCHPAAPAHFNVSPTMREPDVLVIGGGPAGLTAARELLCMGAGSVLVAEKNSLVGGLACTAQHNGYRFDMGGHRFFTKSQRVESLWHEVLQDDLLTRTRRSRIFFQGKFFDYPLRPRNALLGLGVGRSVSVMLSYLRAQLFPHRPEETFEHWVTNRFGRQLFEMFFKTYTEKVWGISCSELKADWAAQRIKDLSLRSAILGMLVSPGTRIRTLIASFLYPRRGPGQMWEAFQRDIESRGGEVWLNTEVIGLEREDQTINSVTLRRDDEEVTVRPTHVVASMPITELVQRIAPPPPRKAIASAQQLRYRDFLTVCLILDKDHLFPDNWIYIHDPSVRVGRIQNFKNWSPDMVADPSATSLGLEYFCNEGDDLWNRSDRDLLELGARELEQIGLAEARDVVDGAVFRVPKSYPVYDAQYREHLDQLKELIGEIPNLQMIGRNGLHRYNNQDHAMLTGILAAENIMRESNHDLWQVNADDEYHEEVKETATSTK